MSQGLRGVRQAARKRKQERFTTLLRHLSVELLCDSFYALKRQASPGVDGVTWQEYETGLQDRLIDLHSRVHRAKRPGDFRSTERLVQRRRLHGAQRHQRIRSAICGVTRITRNAARRQRQTLMRVLTRAKKQREIRSDADLDSMADFFESTLAGIRMAAKAGKSRHALRNIAAFASRAYMASDRRITPE
jgi:hypothetical protein